LCEGDEDGANEEEGEGRGGTDEGEEELTCAPPPLVGSGAGGGGREGLVESAGVEALVRIPAKGFHEDVSVGGETVMGGLRWREYVLRVKCTETLEGVGFVGKARAGEGAPSFAQSARPRQVLSTRLRRKNVASEGEP